MERKKWVAFLLVCTLLVLQFNTNVEAQNMLGESTENIVRYKDNEKRAEKDYSSGILCSVQGGLPKEIVQNGFKYYFNYDDSENLIKMSIGKKEIFHAAYSDDNLCKITYDNGNVIEYHYDENGNMLFNSINGNPAYQWVYEDGDVCKIIDFRYGHVYNMSQSENDSDIKKYAVDNKFSMTQCEDDDKTVTEYRVGTERKKTTKYYGANDERRIGKLIDHSKNIVEVKDNRKKYIISNGSDNIIEMNAYKSGGGISELAFGDGSKFEYKYKDGNIVSVSENDRLICSYVYDRENRLIRENNCRTGKTYIYEYGAGNNLSKVCEYNYLEEDKLNENGLLDVCNYDYGDEWSDLLTEFDRQEIQYDKIGNPLVYRDGMRLQWSFGRQLTEVHSGANFITYQYDYDGNRIAKNVNGRKTSYYYDDSNLVYQFDEEHEIWYIYDVDGYVAGFVLDGDSYYYKKNVTDDVVGIYDDEKNLVAEYIYDAWGKVINILGDKSVAEANPIRYKSYYYDTETGFYYLMNRYYDPVVKRMLNADQFVSISCPNLFTYAMNNPVMNADSSGNAVETVIDIMSIGWDFVDLIKKPSWINLGFLAWDVGSVFIPFVPGSYAAKGGKKLLKVASKADDFKDATHLTIGTYNKVKKVTKGAKGVEVHHVIEGRFLQTGHFKVNGKKVSKGQMMSVPVEKKLHQEITNRWRKKFPQAGKGYDTITKKKMKQYIKGVYKDMPALKKYALKYLEETWEE